MDQVRGRDWLMSGQPQPVLYLTGQPLTRAFFIPAIFPFLDADETAREEIKFFFPDMELPQHE